MARYNNPVTQYGDDSLNPLVGGLLYFYESGSPTKFKDTFKDPAFAVKNTNPVELGGAGRIPSIFLDGNYRVVLTTSNGLTEQIWERDPVQGSPDVSQFGDWNILLTYGIGDTVIEGGLFYKSITNNNLGNNPTSTPSEWEQIFIITVWNANQTYVINDIVQRSGKLYTSLTDPNTGNDPVSSPSDWVTAAGTAAGITYDNTTSGLTATDVQAAIDETVVDYTALTGTNATNIATNVTNIATNVTDIDDLQNLAPIGWYTITGTGPAILRSEGVGMTPSFPGPTGVFRMTFDVARSTDDYVIHAMAFTSTGAFRITTIPTDFKLTTRFDVYILDINGNGVTAAGVMITIHDK